MAVFLRKLFGIGKLPVDMRAEIEAEGLVYLAEYVAVTRRFTGAIPGLRASHTVGSYVARDGRPLYCGISQGEVIEFE